MYCTIDVTVDGSKHIGLGWADTCTQQERMPPFPARKRYRTRGTKKTPVADFSEFSQGFPDPHRVRKCMHSLTSAPWAEPSLA